jgi:hypothetical protein
MANHDAAVVYLTHSPEAWGQGIGESHEIFNPDSRSSLVVSTTFLHGIEKRYRLGHVSRSEAFNLLATEFYT